MFSRLIGNEEVKVTLDRLLTTGRLPGSLLFTGEEGVGKKLFALEVAKALNCRNRVGAEACDECSSCRRIAKSEFPPFSKDDDNKERLIWSEHADVAIARPYKQIIRVPVMRELEREANFRPFEGAARVFIIEDAEYMNEAASNALLKVLEEPPPTTHLILTTTNPTALLATIRSRCQVIRFAPVAAEKIEKFLIDCEHTNSGDAELLARISRGSIGRACAADVDDYRERRDTMLTVLEALTVTGNRVQLLRAAEELGAARDRADYEASLAILETLIRDAWGLALGRAADSVANVDVLSDLQRIAAELRSEKAASWLSIIEDLRGTLEVNINKRIASDGLMLKMAAA
ncbi:MAG TPA: DNA polymerase III subunit delta' [Pyrinomonadaceae bacterium]|jgi:DNA polymerase-3 subunit delta'|nr:DNA polymerase III subunit delta' [Pyrinomonadaceae bacterium]